MTAPSIRLSFFKLNTADMDAALEFYRATFGFAITMTFDEPEFLEHILGLPGQEAGPNLLLVEYKDGRDVTPGPGHGPVGFNTDNIEALYCRAMTNGAKLVIPLFETGGVKVAILTDPEGHEIELVQLPAG
ncbi:MAG TPA: VOC family protein [Alteraurantiacibacter sp.]